MVNTFEAISVTPLSNGIGAEIQGVDLRRGPDGLQLEEIYRAVTEYCVVVFPGPQLDIHQFGAFAKALGQIYEPSYSYDQVPPGTVVSVLDAPAAKGAPPRWHVDELWTTDPNRLALLAPAATPQLGGDTAFANMYAAYDALSEQMKAFLEPLTVFYPGPGKSASLRIKQLEGLGTPEAAEKRQKYEALARKAETMGSAEHRLVQTHPDTGRRHLYFSPQHLGHILDLAVDESRVLVEFLTRHTELLQFQYRHRWSAGDVALWDERCSQHAVVQDYEGSRPMWRCYIA